MDIINITCGEIQSSVGFLYVILPVLLNHTNNPDCDQSWLSEFHFSHVTAYRVRNQTAATPNSDLQNEVSLQHSEIQTPVGFLYLILPVILNHISNPDCEQSWYLQDGRLIADPSDPQRMIDPVISVSSDRLFTSRCVNLNHQIILRNQTAVTPNSDLQNAVTPDLQHSVAMHADFQEENHSALSDQTLHIRSANSEESNCSDSKLRCCE
ncbi:hypothetical protein ROHU_000966 [Labeo rohita]|uniref:Uncharacterized protein n=1 Tax=Labeo rohita TaxID=84645 RepID=A0A498P326_LABRO|nr:hypothetical protein ROHU_000966 [Labeo rohita]